MNNNNAKIDFNAAKSSMIKRTTRAVRTAKDWTMVELHKYLSVLKLNSPTFTSLVGDYNPDEVDIQGMSMAKSEALILMNKFLMASKVAGTPFTKMVQTSAEVLVSPRGYTVTDKTGETKDIKMVRGLPGTEQSAMIIAHEAVTLAMITSTPESDKVEDKESRRMVTKMARPVVTDAKGEFYPPFCIMSLTPILSDHYVGASGILDVRARLLSSAEKSGNIMAVGALAIAGVDMMVRSIKDEHRWKPKWQMFDCIKEMPKDSKNRKVYEECSIDPLAIVPVKDVPRYAVKSLPDMYTFLEMNREIRGSDSGKISPLTHAVYYGELDHYYRQVTSCADVMYIMNELKANAVVHSTSSYFKSAWTLLQLNVPVYSIGVSLAVHTNEKFGVFRASKADTSIPLHIDCLSLDPPKKNSKTKLWEYNPVRKIAVDRIRDFLGETYANAIKVYPYPELWEDFAGFIYPSLHAHSGVVWICSIKGSPYSMEDHIARVCRANVLKTYYPCLQRRMVVGDILTWPTICVKRSTKRVQNCTFEIMYDTDDAQESEQLDLSKIDIAQNRAVAAQQKEQQQQPTVVSYTKAKNEMLEALNKERLEAALLASKQQAEAPSKTVNEKFEDVEIDDDNAYEYGDAPGVDIDELDEEEEGEELDEEEPPDEEGGEAEDAEYEDASASGEVDNVDSAEG